MVEFSEEAIGDFLNSIQDELSRAQHGGYIESQSTQLDCCLSNFNLWYLRNSGACRCIEPNHAYHP